MKKHPVIILATCLILSIVFTAKSQTSTKHFLGTWEFVCKQADYDYREGDITIFKNNKKLAVKVTLKNGMVFNAETVKLLDGTLSFQMYIENALIRVSLVNTDGVLNGKVLVPDAPEMDLKASKKKK
ncbi:hypothetical protein [Flavivirga eckloniae]|uniref:Lipocalin-like domain-containing protein n=1 Tax=Flavivirga eckloniae TaxID=1803846 RepID=A0A2K9PJS1_9FLAO|nr:hypothetical protein [Flavivirga eckloniae]AUP77300.1 hypothetical protein C1H87_00620 [Flavivirga eckloniae]